MRILKILRLFYQILFILCLISIPYSVLANEQDEFGHVTTQYDNNNLAVNSAGMTSSFAAYLKEKRDYLWILVLIIALYFWYRTKQKVRQLAQEISKLKQQSAEPDAEEKYWLASALPEILIFIAILSVLATIFVIGLYLHSYYDGSLITEHARWGTFGDFVGGTLNSIFGLLGLIALLFTIVLQSRELQLARREFQRSTNSSSEQSNTFKQQRFESTFFHLLNLHSNIVNSLELRETIVLESITRGSECFAKCYKIFRDEQYFVRYDPIKMQELPKIQQEIILENTFNEFLIDLNTRYQLRIEHYFTHLCNMIEFIDKDEIQVFISDSSSEDKSAKQRYMSIILSLLSDAEIILLFFYCISKSSHCWKLIMKYSLLNNIQANQLLKVEYCEYYLTEHVFTHKKITTSIL